MSTTMHRLQISLPRSQLKYLTERARREGTSIAELIRRLIHREAETASKRNVDSIWEIVGIGEDRKPLINNIPVSEQPDLYLSETEAVYKRIAKQGGKPGRKRR